MLQISKSLHVFCSVILTSVDLLQILKVILSILLSSEKRKDIFLYVL